MQAIRSKFAPLNIPIFGLIDDWIDSIFSLRVG
jgi:hypothetical protein